jgi:hypothetical protein
LTLRDPFIHDYVSDIEEHDHHCFHFQHAHFLLFSFSVKWMSFSESIVSSFLDRIEKSTFQHMWWHFQAHPVLWFVPWCHSKCSPVLSLFLSEVFGTIFAQTLLMFNWSCKICRAVSLSIFTISAIIRMLRRRSFGTVSQIFWIFLGFWCWRTYWTFVVFHFPPIFHEPFVSFKNSRAWRSIIIVHLL